MTLPLSGGFAGASCLTPAFLAGALDKPRCAFAGVGVGVGGGAGLGAGFAAATVGAAFLAAGLGAGAGAGADFLPTNMSCNPRPICSKRLG